LAVVSPISELPRIATNERCAIVIRKGAVRSQREVEMLAHVRSPSREIHSRMQGGQFRSCIPSLSHTAEAMARAAVEQHERAHVDSSEAAAALARVLVAAGKIEEAHTVAATAVARAPDELNGQIAAADVELSEKHPELAIVRLNKAVAARLPEVPHRFDAELLLARALSAAGKTQEAESRFRTLVHRR